MNDSDGMDAGQAGNAIGGQWSYGAGHVWARIQDPLEELADEKNDWNATIKRAGYVGNQQTDGIDVDPVVIYAGEVDTPLTRRFNFFVELSLDSDSIQIVWVENLPALIELLAALMPAKTAICLERFADKIGTIAEKFFRATHGHDYWRVCRQCDPHEWERQQEAWRAHQAAKAAKAEGE